MENLLYPDPEAQRNVALPRNKEDWSPARTASGIHTLPLVQRHGWCNATSHESNGPPPDQRLRCRRRVRSTVPACAAPEWLALRLGELRLRNRLRMGRRFERPMHDGRLVSGIAELFAQHLECDRPVRFLFSAVRAMPQYIHDARRQLRLPDCGPALRLPGGRLRMRAL